MMTELFTDQGDRPDLMTSLDRAAAAPTSSRVDERTRRPEEPRRPSRRPLQIYAFDPMLGRSARTRIVLDVPNEEVKPGPIGAQIEIVDYDATHRVFYPQVDLDDPEVLMGSGLDPSESDPRFHQQMVYAVASRVIENFEKALGRKWTFRGGKPLRLYPHAFALRNAYLRPRAQGDPVRLLRRRRHESRREHPGSERSSRACRTTSSRTRWRTPWSIDCDRTTWTRATGTSWPSTKASRDIVAIFQHFSFAAILRGHDPEDPVRPPIGRAVGDPGAAVRLRDREG